MPVLWQRAGLHPWSPPFAPIDDEASAVDGSGRKYCANTTVAGCNWLAHVGSDTGLCFSCELTRMRPADRRCGVAAVHGGRASQAQAGSGTDRARSTDPRTTRPPWTATTHGAAGRLAGRIRVGLRDDASSRGLGRPAALEKMGFVHLLVNQDRTSAPTGSRDALVVDDRIMEGMIEAIDQTSPRR